MTAEKMMEILKKEYGIGDKNELDTAIRSMPGIDIGLFTASTQNRRNDEEKISA